MRQFIYLLFLLNSFNGITQDFNLEEKKQIDDLPEIILIDLKMSGMGGTELLKGILMDVDKKGNYFLPDQLEIVREQLSSKIPPPALKSEDLLSEQTGFGFVR
jgi:hypothetical protein